MVFANGHEDEFDLKHYKLQDSSTEGCNYLGNLRNTPSSIVAVTGCLQKPEDKMEITMLSNHSLHNLFTVDINGNAHCLLSPFEEGGRWNPIDVLCLMFEKYMV